MILYLSLGINTEKQITLLNVDTNKNRLERKTIKLLKKYKIEKYKIFELDNRLADSMTTWLIDSGIPRLRAKAIIIEMYQTMLGVIE